LRAYYSKEQLVGKKVVVITNLQPAKLRGVESQGMMLAAEAESKVLALTPGGDAEPGDQVGSGMVPGDKKLSFQEFQSYVLKVGTLHGDEVDVGRKVKVDASPVHPAPRQVAVFLNSADAAKALLLFTAKGTAITVDGELANGAQVR
jgi:methionyl-tRNA synthetase